MIKPSHAVAISVGCLAVAALTMCMSRPTNLAHGVSVRSTIRSPMMVRNLGGGISPRASPGCTRTAVHAVAPAGIPGTNVERTFIAIKPDGVQRRHIGEIIRRFENKGFKLVAMKLMRPTKEQAEGHYDSLRSKPFFGDLADYFSSGPICAMVWEGKNVIATGRQMLGATNPAESMPGTIRGDLCIEVGRNVCHGSDGPESAQKEINYWFTPEEVVDWGCADAGWIYEEPPTPSL